MGWLSRLFGSKNGADETEPQFKESMSSEPLHGESIVSDKPALRVDDDGTIVHSTAGLIWQAEDDGIKRNWEEADTYCSDLSFAGFNDWRLPTLREFESLDQASRDMGLTINTVFSRTGDGDYWSSTPGPQSNVAYVALGETMFRSNKYFVRAVRTL